MPRRCENKSRRSGRGSALTDNRFVDCEEWRKSTNLDDTVPTWEYPEKEQMFKFYPQYYHKTDKVW